MALTEVQRQILERLVVIGFKETQIKFCELWGVCPTCGSDEIVKTPDGPVLCAECDGGEEPDGAG